MITLQALLLIFALQSARIGPRTGSGPIDMNSCPVTQLTGQLVFPAFVAPVHFVTLELKQDDDPYAAEREATTGPYEQFHFDGLRSGNYTLSITMAGMDVVTQSIILTRDVCAPTPGAHIVVPLHRSPAIKPSPIEEDAVSIDTLMAKIPNREVSAFEKVIDKDSKGDSPEAAATLQEILKTAPDYYDANLELALQYKKAGQHDDAQRLLTHALELNSGSMLARAALGQYRFEAGDFKQSAELLEEAVRLGNSSADVYFMLGTSYYKLGQLAAAEGSLLRALDINPTVGQARLQLYNVYMRAQEPGKALAAAKTYLNDYPNAEDRDYVRSMVEKRTALLGGNPGSDRSDIVSRPAQITDPEVAAAIKHATEYVAKYEADLGNLIGTEESIQTLTRFKIPDPRLRTLNRRTSADFMMVNVGSQWVALREVNKVNGAKVIQEQPPFETAFDNSPESNTKRFNSMKADSTKYNIGDVLRENNLPTFALEALETDNVARFSFEKDGTEKIGGSTVWRIKFHENTGPALVRTRAGEDLYSTGTFWIEPESGRVLKTEFHLENPYATPAISSKTVVNYTQDKGRGLLLPAVMDEHYQTVNQAIDCHSEYSHFHPFTVDVKFDLGPTKP